MRQRTVTDQGRFKLRLVHRRAPLHATLAGLIAKLEQRSTARTGTLASRGVSLHPDARELAEHGRDRDRHSQSPMPGNRRIANRELLQSEVAAWQKTRNAQERAIEWNFTRQEADRNRVDILFQNLRVDVLATFQSA